MRGDIGASGGLGSTMAVKVTATLSSTPLSKAAAARFMADFVKTERKIALQFNTHSSHHLEDFQTVAVSLARDAEMDPDQLGLVTTISAHNDVVSTPTAGAPAKQEETEVKREEMQVKEEPDDKIETTKLSKEEKRAAKKAKKEAKEAKKERKAAKKRKREIKRES